MAGLSWEGYIPKKTEKVTLAKMCHLKTNQMFHKAVR